MITLTQALESDYIAAQSPNIVIFDGVDGNFDMSLTLKGKINKTYQVSYPSFDGNVQIDLLDFTKQLYGYLKNYVDPFDYVQDKLFTETDEYHFMLLDLIAGDGGQVEDCECENIVIVNGNEFHLSKNPINADPAMIETLEPNDIVTDGYWDNATYVQSAIYKGGGVNDISSWVFVDNIEEITPIVFTPDPAPPSENIVIENIKVINSALQINENLTMDNYLNSRLGVNTKMPIWEGYPHSTSVLTSTGINRILDYDGLGLPDMTYVSEFVRNCGGVYVKWLNKQCGYSYWLFSEVFTHTKKTKKIGDIVNHWTDRRTAMSKVNSLGKKSDYDLKINTNALHEQLKELSSIEDAPEVYLYTDKIDLDIDYSGWLKVNVKTGSFKTLSKNTSANLKLTIELPSMYVQTLI